MNRTSVRWIQIQCFWLCKSCPQLHKGTANTPLWFDHIPAGRRDLRFLSAHFSSCPSASLYLPRVMGLTWQALSRLWAGTCMVELISGTLLRPLSPSSVERFAEFPDLLSLCLPFGRWVLAKENALPELGDFGEDLIGDVANFAWPSLLCLRDRGLVWNIQQLRQTFLDHGMARSPWKSGWTKLQPNFSDKHQLVLSYWCAESPQMDLDVGLFHWESDCASYDNRCVEGHVSCTQLVIILVIFLKGAPYAHMGNSIT